MMRAHKFPVGRVVRSLAGPRSATPPGHYEIMQLLPSRDGADDPQYRVKSTTDGHQRTVQESEVA